MKPPNEHDTLEGVEELPVNAVRFTPVLRSIALFDAMGSEPVQIEQID